ncbi:MAG: Maf family nucleotide pyrophosphatase [Prolixibacteraceae bacterium]|nr:Maf family nucleotide pyrophosphatase [Prolixibacteraceae bacterium]
MEIANLKDYKIILASKSPRRQQLLQELGLPYEIMVIHTDESYPENLPVDEIPEYIARKKAAPFKPNLPGNTLVITADTVVAIDEKVLGKPAGYDDAFDMLNALSGRWHRVSTGVCLLAAGKEVAFTSVTKVLFKNLTNEEISHYITHYKPFDKAGAYGIQEWIGYIAVEKIEGSYFNVMGLPVQRLYEELCGF